jgi:hypothetical protein
LPRGGPCTRLCLLQLHLTSTTPYSNGPNPIQQPLALQSQHLPQPANTITSPHPPSNESDASHDINEISTTNNQNDIPNPQPICATTKHSTKQYKAAPTRTSSFHFPLPFPSATARVLESKENPKTKHKGLIESKQSHLHAQLASLSANLADLENLLRMTSVQAESVRGLGAWHGGLYVFPAFT